MTDARPNATCLFTTLGITGCLDALDVQRAIAARRADGVVPDCLLLLEHPHTYSLGRRADPSDVLLSDVALRALSVDVCRLDRGGLVTYHGPGQLVGYPILDFRPLGGARRYVRSLETVLMDTLSDFGLAAHRLPGLPGAWLGQDKVAAIGVRISRGVTTHGFALNVGTDLSYFRHIVPCGDPRQAATSMERALGGPVPLEAVASRLAHHFGLAFGREMREAPLWELLGRGAEVAARYPSAETGATIARSW